MTKYNIKIHVTFSLNSEMKASFDKTKEQGKILIDTIKFDIDGKEMEFIFNECECYIQEDIFYNNVYLEIFGYNKKCFDFGAIFKYLSNINKIKDIKFKSNCHNKLKNFEIKRIEFKDENDNLFHIDDKIIKEYNKRINKELIIYDSNN